MKQTTVKEIIAKANYYKNIAEFSSNEFINAFLNNKEKYADEMLADFVKFSTLHDEYMGQKFSKLT